MSLASVGLHCIIPTVNKNATFILFHGQLWLPTPLLNIQIFVLSENSIAYDLHNNCNSQISTIRHKTFNAHKKKLHFSSTFYWYLNLFLVHVNNQFNIEFLEYCFILLMWKYVLVTLQINLMGEKINQNCTKWGIYSREEVFQ